MGKCSQKSNKLYLQSNIIDIVSSISDIWSSLVDLVNLDEPALSRKEHLERIDHHHNYVDSAQKV